MFKMIGFAHGFAGVALLLVLPALGLQPDAFTPRPARNSVQVRLPKHRGCFAGVDTARGKNKYLTTTGCGGTFYLQVNSRWVLRLTPRLPVQYDSCTSVAVGGTGARLAADLLVFDPGKAHMYNLCSDVLVANASRPRQRLRARAGRVVVGFRPTTDYGSRTYTVSLWVQRLEFVDPKTRKRIVLENQLLWRVTNILELG
jgi:hypothetical protein